MEIMKEIGRAMAFVVMIAVFIMTVVILATPAKGAIIYVPDDYTTIQGAVNASSNGDHIRVKAGTYDEDVVISGKSIHLISNGYRTATISGNGTAAFPKPVIKIQSCTVTIDGFVIQNGTGQYLEQALG